MSNLVIVAIPDQNDHVWKISSEKVPHLTLLFLGDIDQVPNPNKIVDFVGHAANTTLNRFYLQVDRRDVLGDDQADVLFFKKDRYTYKAIRDFRAALLKDDNIRKAYDSATQFEGPWTPHMTLGYPATPAKPDEKDYGFYSVEFNKISVWVDDYDGPEFWLKDYWDEYETLDAIPMDVAMSSMNQVRVAAGMESLEHHGVKGMRWGVTREHLETAAAGSNTKVGKAVLDATKFTRDVEFESATHHPRDEHGFKEASEADKKLHNEASSDFRKQDLGPLKERHPNARFLKRLTRPVSPEVKAYRKDARETYIKRLETTANSMTNASGTRQYTIREKGGELPTSKYSWEVTSRKIQHAADDKEVTTVIQVIMDDDGYITDLKPVENSDAMAQTAVLGASFLAHVGLIENDDTLEHYGVKGMKWGVRKNPRTGLTEGEKKREGIQNLLDPQGHALSDDVLKTWVGIAFPVIAPLTWPANIRLIRGGARGVQKKALDVQEKKFAKNAMTPKNFAAIHNGSLDKVNRDVAAINAKYPNPSKSAATKKKYDDEVLKAMQDGYRESANSLTNRANTMHLDLEFKNDGADFTIHARQGPGTPQPKRVKHAVEDDLENEEITVEITGKIKRDATTGHIIGLVFDDLESSAQHTVDLGATLVSTLFGGEVLEHYGVKGMRWGVRREGAVTTQTHIDTGIARRRTQVQAKGGESHPAHEDAINAAIQRRKLKKSGTAALSNKELRELASRIQLETQVAILTSSKGRRFVQQQIEQEGKEQFKKGTARAAPHVIRKVRRGAAVGAAAAALA